MNANDETGAGGLAALPHAVRRRPRLAGRRASARFARVEAGDLEPRVRELVFVAGYPLNRYGEAARASAAGPRTAPPTTTSGLLLKILEFYRGLRGFQDAQKLVSFWRSGVLPEIKPPLAGTTDEIYRGITASRGYIANGFRVNGADGEWLRLYLQRSDAIKRSPRTIDERAVQLLSMAITLKNHGYSDNWNDGCIQVHETRRARGAGSAEVLEVVQIMELCDSMTTAWEGATLLDLAPAAAGA
ncbi:MAG: hypothetical protein IPI73_14390 [Betaproteobacteria bacterium]|nr:hypothetical protein [Betaproteobacteria bacterium]